jgi:O-antigen ligase
MLVTLLTGPFRSWASGWVPALVVAGGVIFLRWPRLGLAIALLMAAIALINYSTIQTFLLEGNEYSFITRTAATRILLEIIQANPLLGVGPANYFYYTPLYAILGWYVRFNSHNQYIDIVAQTGLVGMACLVWFAAAAGWSAWKLRRRAADGFSRGYVNACLAILAAMLIAGMLGDWFLPFVYNIGIAGFRSSVLPWLFIGGLVALEHLLDQPASAAPVE